MEEEHTTKAAEEEPYTPTSNLNMPGVAGIAAKTPHPNFDEGVTMTEESGDVGVEEVTHDEVMRAVEDYEFAFDTQGEFVQTAILVSQGMLPPGQLIKQLEVYLRWYRLNGGSPLS